MIDFYFMVTLSLAMLAVVYCDCRYYLIPNTLNLLLVLLYAGAAVLLPVDVLPAIGTAALVFFFGMLCFHFRIMGGGDVKLLAALSLWTSWGALSVEFLLLTAIFGGVIILIVGPLRLLLNRNRAADAKKLPRIFTRKEPIPYGLAIASAFEWLILTQPQQLFTAH